MSDRVAVLSHGHIEQIGKPQDIYLRPASRFVAEFIGSSNLLPGQLVGRTEGHVEVVTPAGLRLRVRCDTPPAGSNPTILIRPERIRVIANGDVVQDSFTAEIIALTYLGDDLQLQALIDGRETMLIAMKASSQALPAMATASPCRSTRLTSSSSRTSDPVPAIVQRSRLPEWLLLAGPISSR